jgi:ATP-dependent DNA helicase RecG
MLGLDESERVEFKRGALGAKELAEYAVGIGNSGGGVLVLGVTDKPPREVRGLSEDGVDQVLRARQGVLDSTRVRIEVQRRVVDGKVVLLVDIPARPRGSVFHTADGKYLMRVGESLVGMPESELDRIKREEAVSLDLLAEPVPGGWRDHVSLVELERLRSMLRENQRDELARLGDEALLGALEVFRDENGRRALTRAGVLLVGSPEAIRRAVPYHEVKLLRFDADPLTPTLNEDYRTSLVHCIERADAMIAAVNTVESFQSGLFRVDLPRFPRLAWREALANALAHRDYSAPGTVAVRIYAEKMEVGSPGGWFGGVSEANVLHTEPRRRNDLLASVLQKVGLAERSAVGVKRMYRSMLLGGKSPPTFRSTPGSVTVTLDSTTIDRSFGSLATGAWGEDRSLGVEDLLALALLRRRRRAETPEIATEVQLDPQRTSDVLDRLAERELVVRNGVGRGRYWTLGPEAYRRLGIEHERPADVGMEERTFEGLLLDELKRAGAKGLAPAQMRKWSHFGKDQTTRILTRLVDAGTVVHSGKRGVGSRYWLPSFAPDREGP